MSKFADARNEPQNSGNRNTTNLLNQDVYETLNSWNDKKSNKRYSNSFSISGSYEFDESNLLNIEGNFGSNRNENWKTEGIAVANKIAEPIYSYNQQIYSKQGNDDFGGRIAYQHLFVNPINELSLQYAYQRNKVIYNSTTDVSDISNIESIEKYLGTLYNYHYLIPRTTPEHTFQADFTSNGKIHAFNIGGKYINRNRKSNAEQTLSLATDDTPKGVYTNKMTDKEEVARLYFDYSYIIKELTLRGQVTYDYSHNKQIYPDQSEKNYTHSSSIFVPHLTLYYQLKPNLRLVAESKYKVVRPDIAFLNPFVETYGLNKTFGNPKLKNEVVFSGAANLQYFSQKVFSLSFISAYHLNDGIERYSFMDANGVMNTTYGNVCNQFGMNISNYTSFRLSPKTNISINP